MTKNNQRGTPAEVFLAFLKLGLTSFGGPIAHIGYFRDELVTRRKWVSPSAFVNLVALCQFLPGPASSQLGFALGWQRAGVLGALAAWCAFTLPSAILLITFALGASAFDGAFALGVLHGLKLVAVSVVAQAVYGMARSHTPDAARVTIALLAIGCVSLFPSSWAQLGVIALGAGLGAWWCRVNGADATEVPALLSKRIGAVALILFFVLLIGLPLLAHTSNWLALFDAYYRAGSLVFGGGHVVLPLLEAEVVGAGWVTRDAFLTGYGAAQAVPGPLFTFAAYLGAVSHGLWGASVALVAIFLPGMLVLIGALPFWQAFAQRKAARAMMAGANAAVVGILAAALYNPVFTSTVRDGADFAFAVAGFILLTFARLPSWLLVLGLALISGGLAVL